MSATEAQLAKAERRKGAYRAPGAWFVLVVVLMLGLAADLGSKRWAFRTVASVPVELDRDRMLAEPDHDPIPYHEGKPILPFGLLNLRLVLNAGAVFGIGANHRWFFIAFTFVALAAGIHVFGRYTTGRNWVEHMAIAGVLAGGLGNLYDRIVFGRVRDFLHAMPGRSLPSGWTWPGTQNTEMFPWVFNIADVLLLAGMIVLMVSIHRYERGRRQEQEAAEELVTPEA